MTPYEATPLGTVNLSPILDAYERMRDLELAWIRMINEPVSGSCIRPDVVRAIRADALHRKDATEYLMVFGIGGGNPCRSLPVTLPWWDNLKEEFHADID